MGLAVPELRDPLVSLRLPDERDVDAITDACQDSDIPRFTRVPSPYGRDDAIAYVARTAASWSDGSSAGFAIADATDDSLLGAIGLMRLDETLTVGELGYWVACNARRRGIATRAVRLVARWAVLDLGLDRVELMTRVENVPSQRVADAAGFTREGTLRSYVTLGGGLSDVVMFSLVPADLA